MKPMSNALTMTSGTPPPPPRTGDAGLVGDLTIFDRVLCLGRGGLT